jgi:tetratricopeptide (TPR) repeat protein
MMPKKIILCTIIIFSFFTIKSLSESDCIQQGLLLKQQGKTDAAIFHYQQALAINPLSFEAHFNLGNEFFYREQLIEAIFHYKQALKSHPPRHQVHYNLGVALFKVSSYEEAIENIKKAIELDPNYVKAHMQLGKIFETQKRVKEAIEIYKTVITKQPSNKEAYLALADAQKIEEKYDEAITVYKKYLDLNPNDISVAFMLGCTYATVGNVKEACQAYQKVLDHDSSNIQTLYNIGYVLKMAWRIDEAIDSYKKVLSINPNYDPAMFALGMAYLQKGDFDKGWKQHEYDLKKERKNSEVLRTYLATNSVAGKRILLRREGGIGDTLMFIRYAQILKELGAINILVEQKQLVPLLSRCPYIDSIVPIGSSSLPRCDEAATLMSLPAIFNSNEQTMPRNIPYIFPDPNLVESWGNYLKNDPNFKIGICWQVDVHNDSSRPLVSRRGMPLRQFYPLAQLKGVSFYSLQQFDGVEQINDAQSIFPIHVFDETFDKNHGSFMDSAAVMMHLDLIISVDTAIAHLAGALGRPIWLLLPYAADWRWIAHRKDSPWYPSMRIFKQSTPFNWEFVMHEVLWELAHKLQTPKNG